MSSHHAKIEKLANRLEEWDYKIDRLGSRIKDLPEELRGNAQEKYQKLKDYQATLQEKERALKDSTEHAIQDIEHSFEEVWDTLKLLFEDIEIDMDTEDLQG